MSHIRQSHIPNPFDALTAQQKLNLVHVIETESVAAARERAHLDYGVEAKPHELALFYTWHQVCPYLQETTLLASASACADTLDAIPLAKIDDESVSLNASVRLEMQALLGTAPLPPLELRKICQRDRLLVLTARKMALLKTQTDLAQAAEKRRHRPKPTLAEQEAHMREVFGMARRQETEHFESLASRFPSSTHNMNDPQSSDTAGGSD
jgi:hypothetical protein